MRYLPILLILFMVGLAGAQSSWYPSTFGGQFTFLDNVTIGGNLAVNGSVIDGGVIDNNLDITGTLNSTGRAILGGVNVTLLNENSTADTASIAALTIAAYTNETAINSSIAALTIAAYTNETAINTSKTANKQSDYLNQTAINTSKTANKQSDYLNQTANKQSDYLNQTAINTSKTANKKSDYVNQTAINTTIAGLTVPLVSFPYTADVVDQAIFTATGGWVLTSVKLTPTVAGTGEGAATVMVKLCDSAEAPASGDAMINSTLDLEGTPHTPQAGALTTYTGVAIPDGKIVALDFTGTLTSAVGSITLYGKRA